MILDSISNVCVQFIVYIYFIKHMHCKHLIDM